ncbi:histidinol-phosphate transaminase [Saccharospirillum impatiens]|uniref:histidinol-phosphate transaminase n=1 Tax=Saccharospirillum impatiens TaxID=169438 RepID=UPI00042641BC|nr:histidinol-phosphate transaminase [Saccharospirillum impatiens]
MSSYWSPLVHSLNPYTPGEQPKVDGLIKLNTNENPYPPSPGVAQLLQLPETAERLRLYPDPNSQSLKEALADFHQLTPDQVFTGNGSDDVLAMAFMGLLKHSRPILFPDITYSFYPVYCQLFGVEYQQIPLADDFSLDLDAYSTDNGGIIFANPNAPTGLALNLEQIERLLQRNTGSVVVVDEAYVDFGADSAVPLIHRYPNLLVVQTLSKSRSLAGMRLGFAAGQSPLIDALNRVKNSFNPYPIDRIAEAAGRIAIEDEAYFTACCQKIMATRQATCDALTGLGFTVLPSKTNFLFARPPAGLEAAHLSERLRADKVLIRYFNKPRIDGYVRISIGTDTEMAVMLELVRGYVADLTS